MVCIANVQRAGSIRAWLAREPRTICFPPLHLFVAEFQETAPPSCGNMEQRGRPSPGKIRRLLVPQCRKILVFKREHRRAVSANTPRVRTDHSLRERGDAVSPA